MFVFVRFLSSLFCKLFTCFSYFYCILYGSTFFSDIEDIHRVGWFGVVSLNVFLVFGKSDFELSSSLTCYMFRLLTCRPACPKYVLWFLGSLQLAEQCVSTSVCNAPWVCLNILVTFLINWTVISKGDPCLSLCGCVLFVLSFVSCTFCIFQSLN
jgi:hypothetical protein